MSSMPLRRKEQTNQVVETFTLDGFNRCCSHPTPFAGTSAQTTHRLEDKHVLIGLIGCNKSKMTAPDSVRQLYRFSDLFTGALRYLGGRADVIYALSPTHGLLTLDAVVPPERRTLRNGTSTWRLAWARQVVAALREHHGPSLAGITVELHATP